MEKDFTKAVEAVAVAMLAERASTGIALNGSTLDAVAGSTGFQAVTPTEVAYRLQEEASKERRRWRNGNHRTVEMALSRLGWADVYVSGKRFFLNDRAEAARLREAADAKQNAKRAKARADAEKRAALRATGPTVNVRVYYTQPKHAWRAPAFRVFEVPGSEVLAFAAKTAKAGKAVRIVIGAGRYSVPADAWEWRRGPAAEATAALGGSAKAVRDVSKLEG